MPEDAVGAEGGVGSVNDEMVGDATLAPEDGGREGGEAVLGEADGGMPGEEDGGNTLAAAAAGGGSEDVAASAEADTLPAAPKTRVERAQERDEAVLVQARREAAQAMDDETDAADASDDALAAFDVEPEWDPRAAARVAQGAMKETAMVLGREANEAPSLEKKRLRERNKEAKAKSRLKKKAKIDLEHKNNAAVAKTAAAAAVLPDRTKRRWVLELLNLMRHRDPNMVFSAEILSGLNNHPVLRQHAAANAAAADP
jgi:hypothetical protein